MNAKVQQILTQIEGRLSPNEAAKLLGISRSKIWRLMLRGRLPYFKIGSRRFVRPDDLARMISPAANQAGAVPSREAEADLANMRVK